MSYETIATLMFSTMMLMLMTGQRVFGAIGFVAVIAALLLWGDRGGYDLGFSAAMKLMKWYPLLTLPMFADSSVLPKPEDTAAEGLNWGALLLLFYS